MCLHGYTHTNCILGKIFLKVSDKSLFYFLTLLRWSNEYITSQKLKNNINTQTILFMRNWSSSKKSISFDELKIAKQSKDFAVLPVQNTLPGQWTRKYTGGGAGERRRMQKNECVIWRVGLKTDCYSLPYASDSPCVNLLECSMRWGWWVGWLKDTTQWMCYNNKALKLPLILVIVYRIWVTHHV